MKKILFFLLAFGALAAHAANTYIQVTTTPTDWAGTYLIVCKSQNVVFNGNAAEDSLDAKSGPAIIQNVTMKGDSIIGTAAIDSAVFTIAPTDDIDWPWSIQTHSGYYIGHKDTADNGLSVETEVKKKCRHTLVIEDGNLIATPRYEVSGEYNLQYNKKSDQMRFRYFVPDDKVAIQIYKLVSTPSGLMHNAQCTMHNAPYKIMRNGRLLIINNGQEYNVLGN